MRFSSLRVLTALACAGLLASASSASAASTPIDIGTSADAGPSSVSMLSSTTIIGPTVTTAGIIFGAYFTTTKDKDRGAPAKEETGKAASAWLRLHRGQLREDLALAQGRTVDALASLAQIPVEHRARFGALLRQHRAQLLTLSETDGLTPDRAILFLEKIGEIVMTDEVLSADGRATIARLQS